MGFLYLCVFFAVIFALPKVFHCACNWKIISVHLPVYFQILTGLQWYFVFGVYTKCFQVTLPWFPLVRY